VRGWDGGKRVHGRKRHVIVDTLGLVLKAFVTEADYQDRTVASWLVPLLPDAFPRLKKLWADGGYTGEWLDQLGDEFPIAVEITKPPQGQRGFTLVARRWVVERTFAWLSQSRRLSKDYEYLVTTADAMIYAAMVRLMLRRLARC
jgi:putative transposase